MDHHRSHRNSCQMFMAMHAMQRHVVVYIVSVWQNKQAKSEEFSSVCDLCLIRTRGKKKQGLKSMGESVNPSVRLGRLDWTRSRDNFWKLQTGCYFLIESFRTS